MGAKEPWISREMAWRNGLGRNGRAQAMEMFTWKTRCCYKKDDMLSLYYVMIKLRKMILQNYVFSRCGEKKLKDNGIDLSTISIFDAVAKLVHLNHSCVYHILFVHISSQESYVYKRLVKTIDCWK